MEILIVVWLACCVAAGTIAASKGRSGFGWALLGLVFGPIALLAAAAISKDGSHAVRAGLQSGKMRRCPFCAEAINRDAIKCRYCASDLPPPPSRDIWGREITPPVQ